MDFAVPMLPAQAEELRATLARVTELYGALEKSYTTRDAGGADRTQLHRLINDFLPNIILLGNTIVQHADAAAPDPQRAGMMRLLSSEELVKRWDDSGEILFRDALAALADAETVPASEKGGYSTRLGYIRTELQHARDLAEDNLAQYGPEGLKQAQRHKSEPSRIRA